MECGGEDGWRDGWEGADLVGLRYGGYREMEGRWSDGGYGGTEIWMGGKMEK